MKRIKSARIFGVLQDWDLYDTRFDIERVDVTVPGSLLDGYTDDEIEEMLEYGAFMGCDDDPLGKVLLKAIDEGWIEVRSRWEAEDPCELKLEVDYEEEA